MSFVANCGTKQEPLEQMLRVSSALSDIVWNKYPGCCPVCEKDECICIVRLAEVEERSQREALKVKHARQRRIALRANRTRRKKPRNMIALEEMFFRIFRRNIFAFPIEAIGFHLMEEIGEVSIGVTRVYTYVDQRPSRMEWLKRIRELEAEIADVLSWLFSLSSKLRETFRMFDRYAAARSGRAPGQSRAGTASLHGAFHNVSIQFGWPRGENRVQAVSQGAVRMQNTFCRDAGHVIRLRPKW